MGEGGSLVRTLERGFVKAAPVVVFLFPGAIVCVLAGATGMNPFLFVLLNVAGTVTVVTLLYHFAELVETPIGAVNGFYSRNGVILTVVSVVLTIWWVWDQRRRGRSEIQSLDAIEKELSEGEEESGEGEWVAEDEAQ